MSTPTTNTVTDTPMLMLPVGERLEIVLDHVSGDDVQIIWGDEAPVPGYCVTKLSAANTPVVISNPKVMVMPRLIMVCDTGESAVVSVAWRDSATAVTGVQGVEMFEADGEWEVHSPSFDVLQTPTAFTNSTGQDQTVSVRFRGEVTSLVGDKKYVRATATITVDGVDTTQTVTASKGDTWDFTLSATVPNGDDYEIALDVAYDGFGDAYGTYAFSLTTPPGGTKELNAAPAALQNGGQTLLPFKSPQGPPTLQLPDFGVLDLDWCDNAYPGWGDEWDGGDITTPTNCGVPFVYRVGPLNWGGVMVYIDISRRDTDCFQMTIFQLCYTDPDEMGISQVYWTPVWYGELCDSDGPEGTYTRDDTQEWPAGSEPCDTTTASIDVDEQDPGETPRDENEYPIYWPPALPETIAFPPEDPPEARIDEPQSCGLYATARWQCKGLPFFKHWVLTSLQRDVTCKPDGEVQVGTEYGIEDGDIASAKIVRRIGDCSGSNCATAGFPTFEAIDATLRSMRNTEPTERCGDSASSETDCHVYGIIIWKCVDGSWVYQTHSITACTASTVTDGWVDPKYLTPEYSVRIVEGPACSVDAAACSDRTAPDAGWIDEYLTEEPSLPCSADERCYTKVVMPFVCANNTWTAGLQTTFQCVGDSEVEPDAWTLSEDGLTATLTAYRDGCAGEAETCAEDSGDIAVLAALQLEAPPYPCPTGTNRDCYPMIFLTWECVDGQWQMLIGDVVSVEFGSDMDLNVTEGWSLDDDETGALFTKKFRGFKIPCNLTREEVLERYGLLIIAHLSPPPYDCPEGDPSPSVSPSVSPSSEVSPSPSLEPSPSVSEPPVPSPSASPSVEPSPQASPSPNPTSEIGCTPAETLLLPTSGWTYTPGSEYSEEYDDPSLVEVGAGGDVLDICCDTVPAVALFTRIFTAVAEAGKQYRLRSSFGKTPSGMTSVTMLLRLDKRTGGGEWVQIGSVDSQAANSAIATDWASASAGDDLRARLMMSTPSVGCINLGDICLDEQVAP